MRNQVFLRWLIPLIAILALFAAGMGLFYQTDRQSYPLTSFRGEQVLNKGHGLYYFDTVSSAAQMQANDLTTHIVGLLLLSMWLGFRGSMRGRLLLTGTLAFFLYTYMSMSVLTAYNSLFLVYVTLFGLSLYAFILCMLSFDLADLPRHFRPELPRGWIAGVLFAVGGFLSLAWIGRVVAELMQSGGTGRVGEYDHARDPGNGLGTDPALGYSGGHPAAQTIPVGLPALFCRHHKRADHDAGSQCHGGQYGFEGCSR